MFKYNFVRINSIYDGASVNLKFAKSIAKPVVVCNAHGIHLSINKMLKSKILNLSD